MVDPVLSSLSLGESGQCTTFSKNEADPAPGEVAVDSGRGALYILYGRLYIENAGPKCFF